MEISKNELANTIRNLEGAERDQEESERKLRDAQQKLEQLEDQKNMHEADIRWADEAVQELSQAMKDAEALLAAGGAKKR